MPDDIFRIFKAEFDDGNVADGNRDAVDSFDDNFGDVLGTLIFANGSGDITTFALVKVTGTDVFVFYIEGSNEFRDGHLPGREGIVDPQ